MTLKCEKCQTPTDMWRLRCHEHNRCDDCGAREELCRYGGEGLYCEKCHSIRVEKRVAEFDGDTDFEPEIVCPWCGYITGDSFESSEGKEECCECGRSYDITIDETVTYSTTKIESKKDDTSEQ